MNEFIQAITSLAGRIRILAVPRIEDLPYTNSPPLQWTYESTANLNLGQYVWTDTPSAFTPVRPLLENALYYIRSITLSADVDELVFQGALVTAPSFYTYVEKQGNVPLFREPIRMNRYYEDFTYRLTWGTQSGNEEVLGAFRGTLLQTADLIGKSSVTLKATMTVQEIVDKKFINLFRDGYPKGQ